jgi:hypothetical protein
VDELPEWLGVLIPGERERQAWREVWAPELANRGVTPELLAPVGPPDRPIAIATGQGYSGPWRSGKVDWSDGEVAILNALRRLVEALDDKGEGRPKGRPPETS